MSNVGWQYKRHGVDEEWQDYVGTSWYSDEVAQNISEHYYNDDPGDPHLFELLVFVRQGKDGIVKAFRTTAHTTVNFHTEEVEL